MNKIVYVQGLKTILSKLVIDNSVMLILSFKYETKVRTHGDEKLDFRLMWGTIAWRAC